MPPAYTPGLVARPARAAQEFSTNSRDDHAMDEEKAQGGEEEAGEVMGEVQDTQTRRAQRPIQPELLMHVRLAG